MLFVETGLHEEGRQEEVWHSFDQIREIVPPPVDVGAESPPLKEWHLLRTHDVPTVLRLLHWQVLRQGRKQ